MFSIQVPTSPLDRVVQWITLRIARAIAPLTWITPNRITWVSALIGGLLGGGLILQGHLRWAAAAVILSGLLDGLDGELARERKMSTIEGAILDSVLDRYVDFCLLAALIWMSPRRDLALGLFALMGATLVPYVRARTEAAGKSSIASWGSRATRTVLIILGLLTGQVQILLGVVGAIANLSALHRLTHALTPLAPEPIVADNPDDPAI